MTLSIKEQRAVLQCLWQLFSANPNKEECDFVENTISNGWNCKNHEPLNALDKALLVFNDGLNELHTHYPWIICAIEEDPYESFNEVSMFSDEKKRYFKSIVIDCVENHGDTDYKTAMAVTLFNNTKVLYAIRGKDFLNDKHNGTKTII